MFGPGEMSTDVLIPPLKKLNYALVIWVFFKEINNLHVEFDIVEVAVENVPFLCDRKGETSLSDYKYNKSVRLKALTCTAA